MGKNKFRSERIENEKVDFANNYVDSVEAAYYSGTNCLPSIILSS